jgi:hypothetical protein
MKFLVGTLQDGYLFRERLFFAPSKAWVRPLIEAGYNDAVHGSMYVLYVRRAIGAYSKPIGTSHVTYSIPPPWRKP